MEASRRTRRAWPRSAARLAACAAVGVVVGVLAKVADVVGSWWADAATYPAVWVIPVAVLARTSPGPGQAALRAAAFFVPVVAAYYGWAQLVLGFGSTPYTVVWLAIAAVMVPVLTAVVCWAVRRGPDAATAATVALLGALPFTGGAVQRLWFAATGVVPPSVARPLQAVLEVVVAAVVVLWLPPTRRARLWAALALVPAAWIVLRVVAVLPLPV